MISVPQPPMLKNRKIDRAMKDIIKAMEILRQAMQIEQEGQEFYLKAAQTTKDKKGQEMFDMLAKDEQNHFQIIRKQYNALKSRNKWISSPEIKKTHINLNEPLFPKDKETFEKVITTKSNDIDALLFGLDIENKSYDLYYKAASETTDTLGKTMFEFLAGQERGHFNILMMRYEFLSGRSAGWSA